MKKQKYFINTTILDANDKVIGHRSSLLETNQKINLSLRAKEMVKGWNADKRRADGVSAIVVSFNKI